MPANSFIRRLMTRALRSQKTLPIRERRLPVGRLIEGLEDRLVPSGGPITPYFMRAPGSDLVPALAPWTTADGAYTPLAIRTAYGITSLPTADNGTGQTIALIDAYNDPSIRADLATFDAAFGLSDPPSFQVVSQTGSSTNLPPDSPSYDTWDAEESLDVEWAHAIAPGANIILVECDSESSLYTGVTWAATPVSRGGGGATVISMSFGVDGGYSSETSDDATFNPAAYPGVTFLASTGDNGSNGFPNLQAGYPADSPYVVAVGGTALYLNTTSAAGSGGGTYQYETGWDELAYSGGAGGGGISNYEAQPSYQTTAAAPFTTSNRAAPDVSFDADPYTGVEIYDSQADWGGWGGIGGTSLASPCWAGLMAVTDQVRADAGLSPLTGYTQTLPRLYSIYDSPSYTTDFNDVTSGDNGTYNALPGYDLATGIGSPIANTLVPVLAGSPLVDNDPANVTINAGRNASFNATATGVTGDSAPTEQWQVSTDGGVTFSNITNGVIYSGATTATLTVTGGTAAMNGYKYRDVFTNQLGTATTTAATLTVKFAPIVTTNPSNQGTTTGGTVSFTAAAIGNPAPTVQWKVSTNGGATFTNVTNGGIYSGATTTTLTVTGVPFADNGYKYEAVFSNTLPGSSSPSTATTTVATLYVNAPMVTANPSNATISTGGTTSFTSSAIGSPTPTEQWQVSTDGGVTFSNITNGVIYSGATTATLTVTGGTAAMNGYKYRDVFTNSFGSATTTAATLTVQFAPIVTTNPSNVTGDVGGTASFVSGAIGSPAPTEQWQISTDGGVTFSNISDGAIYSGTTTATLTITGGTAAMSGYEYQDVFTNSFGSATTTAATLTVDPALSMPPATATFGEVGVLYNSVITVSGGTPPYTNVTVTAFKAGGTGLAAPTINAAAGTVTFNSTPAAAGTVTFTVNVTDTTGATLSRNFTFTIAPAVSLQPQSTAHGVEGLPFTRTIPISGGTGVYSDLIVAGLPAGLTAVLSGNSVIVSGVPTTSGPFYLGLSVQDSLGGTGTLSAPLILTPPPPTRFAIGSASGGLVTVFDNGQPARVEALYPGFQGGIAVAVGDLNGDGVPDIATVVSSGGPALVTILDGVTLAPVFSFFALPPSYTGGATIAVADLYGTGHPEIIIGQATGGSVVAVYNGQTGALMNAFFAYPEAPVGVSVAAGDLNGNGQAEIVTTPTIPVPLIKVFDGYGNEVNEFLAFHPADVVGGVSVAVGDVTGSGQAEILVGANLLGGDYARVYNGAGALQTIVALPTRRTPSGSDFLGPQLTVADVNGDGIPDLVFTSGTGLGALVGPNLDTLGLGMILPGSEKALYIG